ARKCRSSNVRAATRSSCTGTTSRRSPAIRRLPFRALPFSHEGDRDRWSRRAGDRHARARRGRCAEYELPGRLGAWLAEPRGQGRRARLLPDLDAEPARREDRRPVPGHLLDRQGPQLPRELPRARRPRERRRARQLPGLSGPKADPALPRARRARNVAVLQRPGRPHECERDPRDRVPGESGRRPVARSPCVALPRRPVHRQPARDQPVRQRDEGPAESPAAAVEPAGMPPEQHLLDLTTTHSEGVEVIVPPLHHAIVTAKLDVGDLRSAQTKLEDVLRDIDSTYPLTPAGLGVTVAWGIPYFDKYVPAQAKAHLPHDRRAQKQVLLPTRRFPSDPSTTILETNDLVVLLRSDRIEHIEAA